MPINLKSRSILTLGELSPAEIRFLLRLAAELKAAKTAGLETPRLKGKNIALIFEKDSTRTRTGFEVAAYDQGERVTYLGPSGSQIGHKESMKDTARVLGRIYDAIEYRGFSQQCALELVRYSGVPVYNGLTDESHPTQALADFMTMREFTHKHLSDMALVFLGNIHNNVARSLALGAMKLGMDLRLCRPASFGRSRSTPRNCSTSPRQRAPSCAYATTRARPFLALISSIPTCGCRWASPRTSALSASACLSRIVSRARACARRAIQVHALPADIPQHGNRGRNRNRAKVRHHVHGGDRRGVRGTSLDRLRPSREPHAHNQGCARGNSRDLTDADRRSARWQCPAAPA
jgi:hypothetical protein